MLSSNHLAGPCKRLPSPVDLPYLPSIPERPACRLNEFRVQRREARHSASHGHSGHSCLATSIRGNRQDPNNGGIRGATRRQHQAQSAAQKALDCSTHGTGKEWA